MPLDNVSTIPVLRWTTKGRPQQSRKTGKGILNDGYTICFPIVEAAHCYEMKLVRAERGYNSLGISEVAF